MERKEHKEDRWVLECSAFCGRNMSSKAVWPNGWGSGLVICWFQVQDFHSASHWICSLLPRVQFPGCTLYITIWFASCLLPIGFFKHCLFIQLFIHLFICIGPEKPMEE